MLKETVINYWYIENIIINKININIKNGIKKALKSDYTLQNGKLVDKLRKELKELEEYDEFIHLDLGYVIPSLIDMWEEKK